MSHHHCIEGLKVLRIPRPRECDIGREYCRAGREIYTHVEIPTTGGVSDIGVEWQVEEGSNRLHGRSHGTFVTVR
jgi:hypothetical protein